MSCYKCEDSGGKVECNYCYGSGFEPSEGETCSKCDGTGRLKCDCHYPKLRRIDTVTCNVCGGIGYNNSVVKICFPCEGTGKVKGYVD